MTWGVSCDQFLTRVVFTLFNAPPLPPHGPWLLSSRVFHVAVMCINTAISCHHRGHNWQWKLLPIDLVYQLLVISHGTLTAVLFFQIAMEKSLWFLLTLCEVSHCTRSIESRLIEYLSKHALPLRTQSIVYHVEKVESILASTYRLKVELYSGFLLDEKMNCLQ